MDSTATSRAAKSRLARSAAFPDSREPMPSLAPCPQDSQFVARLADQAPRSNPIDWVEAQLALRGDDAFQEGDSPDRIGVCVSHSDE